MFINPVKKKGYYIYIVHLFEKMFYLVFKKISISIALAMPKEFHIYIWHVGLDSLFINGNIKNNIA